MKVNKVGNVTENNSKDGQWLFEGRFSPTARFLLLSLNSVMFTEPEVDSVKYQLKSIAEKENRKVEIATAILKNCGKDTYQFNFKIPLSMLKKQLLEPTSLTHTHKSETLNKFCPVKSSPDGTVRSNGFMKDGDKYVGLYAFKGVLFEVFVDYFEENTLEHPILLIKKNVYSSEQAFKKLRKEVKNMENILTMDGKSMRMAIPEAVKLVVWQRDEGKCVRCGSSKSLHFDHVIPVSKGGNNLEENIQILCEYCNLQKSDKISL